MYTSSLESGSYAWHWLMTFTILRPLTFILSRPRTDIKFSQASSGQSVSLTYINGVTGADSCYACPAGYFQFAIGGSNCLPCPPGRPNEALSLGNSVSLKLIVNGGKSSDGFFAE